MPSIPRADHRRYDAAVAISRCGPYDAVVDTMVLRRHVQSQSLAMMLPSRARLWIGEGDRGGDYLLNIQVPRPQTTVTHLSRMLALARPFGCIAQHIRPMLVVTDGERAAASAIWGAHGVRAVINVSTNGSERQWPNKKFAAVVKYLARIMPDLHVVVAALDRDDDNRMFNSMRTSKA